MHRPGGEVDAFCTRCELPLAHTIIAVVNGKAVKMECNTCHAVHRYRDGAGRAEGSTAARAARPSRARAPAVAFDDLLAAKRGPPVAYSPRRSFTLGEVVDHPTFGRGFVSQVRDAGKVEVTFRAEVKVLVHGRA